MELGGATSILLPVRNDAISFRGDAYGVVAHLTYQPLVEPLPPPLEIHRGLWIGRDSLYDIFIRMGETLHLVIAVCDARGCSAPSPPSVEEAESSTAATLRMVGRPPSQSIRTFQLVDGNWRVTITVRGEGFKTSCIVHFTVERQRVISYRVIAQ
jgi:hypothetical protein